jgi:RNA-binding protein
MLTSAQKQQLKARAHPLKPVVITGAAGVSAAVIAEIDRALEHHELIKVRLTAESAQARLQAASELGSELTAEVVQIMGRIVTLYREKKRADEPRAGRRKPLRQARRKGS